MQKLQRGGVEEGEEHHQRPSPKQIKHQQEEFILRECEGQQSTTLKSQVDQASETTTEEGTPTSGANSRARREEVQGKIK